MSDLCSDNEPMIVLLFVGYIMEMNDYNYKCVNTEGEKRTQECAR